MAVLPDELLMPILRGLHWPDRHALQQTSRQLRDAVRALLLPQPWRHAATGARGVPNHQDVMCLAVNGDLAVAGGRIEKRPNDLQPLGDLTLWDWRNRKPLDCVPLERAVVRVAVHAPSGMVAAVLKGAPERWSQGYVPAKPGQVQLWRQTAMGLQSCGPAQELDAGEAGGLANLAVVACSGRAFLCFSQFQPQPGQPSRLALYEFCHPLELHSEVFYPQSSEFQLVLGVALPTRRNVTMASDGDATVAHTTHDNRLCAWKAQAVGERVRLQGEVTVSTSAHAVGLLSVSTGYVAASSSRGPTVHEVHVWHIATCGLLATVRADHHVHSLALRMDWGLLLCGGKANGSIVLYAINSQATAPPAKLGSLTGHHGAVTSIAMLDERVLLSGSLSHDGARSLLRSDLPLRMSLGE